MFIKLKREITIGDRTYPAGSVVEVDKVRRKELVERGHAADHPGPAFEPAPEDLDEGEPTEAEAGPEADAKGRPRPKARS